ncbi:MAG: hypothetical protein Q8M25_16050 [Rhodoferax sp.]|nr:hypothetical protein [Rhodoferax sp.]
MSREAATCCCVSVTNQLCTRRFESRYCHRTIDRHGLSKRLDTFDFVHRLGRKVGLAAAWARPQWNGLNHKQGGPFAKAASNVLQLQRRASAVCAMMFN